MHNSRWYCCKILYSLFCLYNVIIIEYISTLHMRVLALVLFLCSRFDGRREIVGITIVALRCAAFLCTLLGRKCDYYYG